MPRAYRCILVVFVGWLSLANTPKPSSNPERPKAESNEAQPAKLIAPPAPQPVKPVQPLELYRPCGRSEINYNSDLCAQWKAAEAASEAAFWTEWGFWLGLVGTTGLLTTLFYTRAAVKVAQEATKDADKAIAIATRNADAAAEQALISKQSADRQLRPYLIFHQAIQWHPDPDSPEIRKFHATVNNEGYSPAIVLSFEIGVCFRRLPDPDDFPWIETPEERGIIIGRNGAFNPRIDIAEQELWDNKTVIVACRVSYRSLWGSEVRQTQDAKSLKFERNKMTDALTYQGHDDVPEFRRMT